MLAADWDNSITQRIIVHIRKSDVITNAIEWHRTKEGRRLHVWVSNKMVLINSIVLWTGSQDEGD